MMHEDHPNLSFEINAAIRESELAGGIWWRDVPSGTRALVKTKNSLYTIEKRQDGKTYIKGHEKYCPAFVEATIFGSNFGGSMLKVGWIGVGMYMEFTTVDYRVHGIITTSRIQDVVTEPIEARAHMATLELEQDPK